MIQEYLHIYFQSLNQSRLTQPGEEGEEREENTTQEDIAAHNPQPTPRT